MTADMLTNEVKNDAYTEDSFALRIYSTFAVSQDIVVEMVVEGGECLGSQLENFTPANEGITSSFPPSTIERLKMGLEEYVLKHGNRLNTSFRATTTQWELSCYDKGHGFLEHMKVRSAVACNEGCSYLGKVVEAAIAVTEKSEMSNPCSSSSSYKQTEKMFNHILAIRVLRFYISESSHLDQSPSQLVMIALSRKTNQLERKLTKRAVKLALDDLKKAHMGVLTSSRAQKICSYALDLAKAICGVIMTSNDLDFQRQCISLLGLRPQEIGEQTVEECIKEKIVSVIEMNDRKPGRSREAAPLFDEPF
ncbi:hypothetical protein RJ641_002841 [Dillenia turbinata]|uniref:Uncharacterized protein n=1 Tax=Dillenia turbinata TaxID=194707 RepID=A0AAN8VNS6_9MAGN